jgi:hypothetical protein
MLGAMQKEDIIPGGYQGLNRYFPTPCGERVDVIQRFFSP